jgi:hypothetical protein
MPRQRSESNEAARLRQEEYRRRLTLKAEPETDAVDTALAAGLARFLGVSLKGTPEARQMAISIIRMSARHLVARGYSKEASGSRLGSRIYYLQMTEAYPEADGSDRRRWMDGDKGVPDPVEYRDDPDPSDISDADQQWAQFDHEDYADDEAA